MSILIDGYNLLHATHLFAAGPEAGTAPAARGALLAFLQAALLPREQSRCTVVFDGGEGGFRGARQYACGEIHVVLTGHDHDADSQIERLIEAETDPRNLTVVSSDHRLQRAARRRRATAIDSELWFAERRLLLRQAEGHTAQADDKPQPAVPLSPAEVAQWLALFGPAIDETKPAPPAPPSTDSPGKAAPPQPAASPPSAPRRATYNPFPPGYADDVFDEEP